MICTQLAVHCANETDFPQNRRINKVNSKYCFPFYIQFYSCGVPFIGLCSLSDVSCIHYTCLILGDLRSAHEQDFILLAICYLKQCRRVCFPAVHSTENLSLTPSSRYGPTDSARRYGVFTMLAGMCSPGIIDSIWRACSDISLHCCVFFSLIQSAVQ